MRPWSQRFPVVRWVVVELNVLRLRVQEWLPLIPFIGRRFFGKG
jgi:hypothetical protein